MTEPSNLRRLVILDSLLAPALASLAPRSIAQPAMPFSEPDLAHAALLRDQGLRSNLGYELMASLVDEVGPRPAGSPADAKAGLGHGQPPAPGSCRCAHRTHHARGLAARRHLCDAMSARPGANYGWPGSEGPDNVGAGVTAPLFAYKHADAAPLGSGAGGFFKGFAIAGGAFYPGIGAFPPGHRDQYYFADFVSRFVGRIDLANGNAAYAFASLSGQPVDLLVGSDGAVYVLTRSGVTRISAP